MKRTLRSLVLALFLLNASSALPAYAAASSGGEELAAWQRSSSMVFTFLAGGKVLGAEIIGRFSKGRQALLFPLFFSVAAACIFLRNRPGAVKFYLVLFFSLHFFFGGLAG